MFVDEKPSLNDDLLAHFGIKGMKWGVRRATSRSSGGETIRGLLKSRMSSGIKGRLRQKTGMGFMTKAAIGAAVIGGSAAAGYILAKRGSVVVQKPSVQYKRNQSAGREAHRDTMQAIGKTNVSQLSNETLAA